MKITVVGAARSGLAAAYLAQRDGDSVFVTDAKAAESASAIITELNDHGIAHEFGGHTDAALQCEMMIVSPGVPPTNPLRVEGRQTRHTGDR